MGRAAIVQELRYIWSIPLIGVVMPLFRESFKVSCCSCFDQLRICDNFPGGQGKLPNQIERGSALDGSEEEQCVLVPILQPSDTRFLSQEIFLDLCPVVPSGCGFRNFLKYSCAQML